MATYHKFFIEKYKAIKDAHVSVLNEPIPLIGVNESGKSSGLEAIARFDFRNDNIADQKGWKFINRYMPNEKVFSIVAHISVVDPSEMEKIMESYPEAEKNEILEILTHATQNEKLVVKRLLKKGDTGLSYSYTINDLESPIIEKFSRDFILHLPRIFYFDNFLEDQFPDLVTYPPEYFSNPNFVMIESQAIVDAMFTEANVSLKSFLDETDESTKQTQIEEVNRVTTNKLISEWTAMHVGSSDLDIGNMSDLQICLSQNRPNAHAVDINIKEKFKDEEGIDRVTSMPLSERSLGFRWYFNFSSKKSYGARGEEKFVYLFDEPGSYLHNSAQDILLKAIRDLAKVHPVIFSTHSEFLLDPEIININNVRIIEKNDRKINFIPLSEIEEKRTMGALSTLWNALRMKIPISSTLNQKILVTEGITDFYFWKVLTKDVVILPGFGAGSNEYLISIAIGTSKKYLALFDGDVRGEEAIQKYQRFFGEEAKENWKKYVNKNGQEIKLEQILSSSDQANILKITKSKDLKKAITLLFFSNDKDNFWNSIDDETKENLKSNISVYKKELGLTSANFNYQLGK